MKSLKKYYTIPAPPEDIYHALTNPLTIQLWTGEEAIMSTEPDSEFSLWGGSITGRNIEFEPHKKIVQHWYFGDEHLRDEGVDKSIVTIKLHADPKGTSVELRHTNIPDGDYTDISDGWDQAYFGALREFYEE